MTVNKVILIGNVGRDPDVRSMPDGKTVANVSLCTSETWKDAGGQSKSREEWHRLVFFGKPAEVVEKHVKKSAKLYIEGMNRTRKYEKDGVDRFVTEVHVNDFKIIDFGKNSGDQQSDDQSGDAFNNGGQQHSGKNNQRDAFSQGGNNQRQGRDAFSNPGGNQGQDAFASGNHYNSFGGGSGGGFGGGLPDDDIPFRQQSSSMALS